MTPPTKESEHAINIDHCGPIHYPGIQCIKTDAGVELIENSFNVPYQKSDPWLADWIWLDKTEFSDMQGKASNPKESAVGIFAVALLRKVFILSSPPKQVYAWLSADCKYRVYINGQLVGRGPSQIGGDIDFRDPPNWWFYDQYDFTPFLKPGPNLVTAEVVLHPDVGADLSSGQGGFLFEALVKTEGQPNIVLKSDRTWKAILGEAFLIKSMYDARQDPGDWHSNDFNDSSWSNVNVICPATKGPWKLLPREIPPLMELRYSAKNHVPKIITPGKASQFSLEFDRNIGGYLQFALKSPAGVKITFGFQEKHGKTDVSEIYYTKNGIQTFELFRLRSCQYLTVNVNFEEADNKTIPVEIHHIEVNFCSYPVFYKGKFECSDTILNDIWKVGRWTDQLCMQTYHLDSPVHQEPLGDTGDYLIEALISYFAFGESRLARQDLLKTAHLLRQKDYRMFHTSYSLLWTQMLADYYLYTGDLTLVKTLLPDVHKLLTRFQGYIGSSGLITEAPDYMFMDWVKVDKFELHHPPCVIGQGYMSAFYYNALNQGIYFAELCGEMAKVEEYRSLRKKLRIAFNSVLWDEKKQLYRDGIPNQSHMPLAHYLPADVDKIFYSRQTNTLAVLYDLFNGQDGSGLIDTFMSASKMPPVQPYFMHFLLDALAKNHRFAKYGFKALHQWDTILHEHPTSWKESWNFGDYSHAWSGTPTYQLSSKVLGITPVAPSFSIIRINPCLGDLQWLKGTVPTPYGEIILALKRTQSLLTIDFTIPFESTTQFFIPIEKEKIRSITNNGQILWEKGVFCKQNPQIKQDQEINHPNLCFLLQTGSYHFEIIF